MTVSATERRKLRFENPAGCACGQVHGGLSRRGFVAGAVAAGAAAMLPSPVRAQGGKTVIDTHHHYYAPPYQKAWLDWENERKIPHFATQEAWTREKAVEELDKNGVKTAVLSLASTPGLWFGLGAEAAGRMA